MLKQMIIALSLMGATVAVNAQTGKAIQNADGTWTLDNVKLSPEDAASLKNLVSSDKNASLSMVEGGKVATYGGAKLGNLKATRVMHGSKLGNAASDNNIFIRTTTTTKHQLGLDKSRTLQVNALLQKYQ
jgi:hypothetical protein